MDAKTNARNLRQCFGRFATGVTVVTYQTTEGVRGATLNSFTSVSLDPPLVLVSLSRTTRISAAIDQLPFAINVLRADQMDVAMHFAGRPQSGSAIAWDATSGDDPPSLSEAIAVFRCKPWQRYDGGDHVLQVGEVTSSLTREGAPLLFSDGRFTGIGLPMLDGPMVLSLDNPPLPGWIGAAHRLQQHTEAG
ncbi:flavin reductase family protein [Paraburkholderia elongata]|uniref:Flavin reductase n=1 Tax=Paraburkholderia elongata TaxID=2675747 RepID=A0A972SHH2_9BURK|nr:flavin reductase family protein [Paraburkholderia elongata]NPT55963.1 flavin reductase [Paraburkholderia elongata]